MNATIPRTRSDDPRSECGELKRKVRHWAACRVLGWVLLVPGGLGLPPVHAAQTPLDTPVTTALLDLAASVLWDGGTETPLSSQTAVPDVLWTQDSLPNGPQFTFGATTNPGPRRLRFGFNSPLPVGSVLVLGRGRLSVLKDTAPYPGDLSDESHWTPAQRIRHGAVSGAAADAVAYQIAMTLWVLPPGTTTRALRITVDALYLDEKHGAGIQRLYVFSDRVANLSPAAFILPPTNPGSAAGLSDEFGGSLWDNTPPGSPPGSGGPNVVSPANPEDILLLWPQPVELAGLATFENGFGTAEIQSFIGAADQHPRGAAESDWQTVMSLGGFSNEQARVAGPLIWSFPSPVTTRALRLRIVQPSESPFHSGQTAGGKRVWLNELMALKPLGSAPPDAGIVPPAFPQTGPVPVTFTLSEPSVVTLVIEDASGKRVKNLVSETAFPAGANTVWWDGFDDRGILSLDNSGFTSFFDPTGTTNHGGGLNRAQGTLASPGTYRVRGLRRQAINLRYEFTAYNSGEPPWPFQNGVVPVWDTTGQWLADHYPPRDVVFLPGATNQVFIASPVAEAGDGMVWVDLDGRKLAGRRSVFGWTCNYDHIEEDWTGASHVARDDGPNALPDVAAYLAVSFHDGLRIHTISPGRCLERVIKRPWDQPQDADVLGIAARDGRLVVSVNPRHELWFIDATTGQYEGAAALNDPRGLTFDSSGRLLALSGNRLLRFELTAGSTALSAETEITASLEDPRDVELDASENLYVSQHGTRHNVKVFTSAGTFMHEIGVPGPIAPGPYDELHMQHPEGMTITPDGHLWVAEFDHAPKRVSVWNLDGTFVKAFYGPTKYGGGGQLDPTDRTRFYLFEQDGGMEFELDWTNGTSRLASVYYRPGPNDWKMPIQDWGRSAAGPETPIYCQGHQYMTDAFGQDAGAGVGLGIWRMDGGIAVPVAAAVLGDSWPLLAQSPFKEALPPFDPSNPHFVVWSDLNSDAQVQTNELQFRPERAVTFTVNERLELSTSEARIYRPLSFTGDGVPVYDLQSSERLLPDFFQAGADVGGILATTNDWSLIIGGPIRGVKDGEVKWHYASDWPSLPATWQPGRPPLPRYPGQLIGTTRLLGLPIVPAGSDAGQIFGVNGNLGNLYLFTTDGLFVATCFHDTRVAPGWRMPYRERGMLLNDISLEEETFHPSLTQVENGEVYLAAGHNHASIVKVEGLETIQRFDAPDVVLTPELLTQAHSNHVAREAARVAWQGRDTLFVWAPANAPVVDGQTNDWAEANWVDVSSLTRAAVAVASGRLFVVLVNSQKDQNFNDADDPVALFHSGGGIDVMLGTDPAAEPNRQAPVMGDLRVLVTRRNGLIRALVLRPVSTQPGTPGEFASSWRTNSFASIEDISHLVELGTRHAQDMIEIAMPLSALGLTPSPGQVILGDVGVLRGKAGHYFERVCWHNKAANVVLDLAGDTMLTPQLWGCLQFPATLPPQNELLNPLPELPPATNQVVQEGTTLTLDFRRGQGLFRQRYGYPADVLPTLSPNYPNLPDSSELWVSDLEIPELPLEQTDFGATRARAFFAAPLTGEYVFWIASDEPSALRLWPADQPAGITTLASVPDGSPFRQWDRHPSQRSAPASLEAGRQYVLEALRAQNYSSVHFSVRWQLPDGTIEEPIPAWRLIPVQGFVSPADLAGANQQSEFSLDSGAPAGAAVDPQTGVLTWTPGADDVGKANEFTVRLSDLGNPSTSVARSFTVTVVAHRRDLLEVIEAGAYGSSNSIIVTFSHPIEDESALDPTHYSVSGGVIVHSVTFLRADRVRLNTSALTPGVVYTVTVNGVRGRQSTTPLAVNATGVFTHGDGGLTYKVFRNLSGQLVSDLTNDARFPDQPDETHFTGEFATPSTRGDNYGVLLQGYLTPPLTGDYVFALASDDQSELFLSADDNPANKVLVARQPEWSEQRMFRSGQNHAARFQLPAELLADAVFIEAEDFDFGGGQWVTDTPIGMTGPYAGGAYAGLGTAADAGMDWFEVDGQGWGWGYRDQTAVELMELSPTGNRIRGAFQVSQNYRTAENEAGDWYNYTREFPEPARDYCVFAWLTSGGADIAAQLDEVTAGRGTASQSTTPLGTFTVPPTGPWFGGWEAFAPVPLRDAGGALARVNLGGLRTLRFTVQPGNLDFDHLLLVPAGAAEPDLSFLKPVNVSDPLPFTAHQRYYVEARFKEGTGNDHFAVAWQPPGGPPIVDRAEPVPGAYLSALGPGEIVPASIAVQPVDALVNEGQEARFQVVTAGTPPFTYQWYRNDEPLSGATPTDGQFGPVLTLLSWDVGVQNHGVRYRVRASNALATVLSDEVILGVNPPRLNVVPGQEVTEGQPLQVDFSASDNSAPAQTLTYSLDPGAPDGAAIDPATGTLTWTPTEAQGPAVYETTVRVTDSDTPPLSDALTFTVTVLEDNTAPTLDTLADESVDEGEGISFTAAASDNDLPPQKLTFSLAPGAPEGTSISPEGEFQWTAAEAHGPGVYPITIRVTDDGTPPLSSEQTFTVMVRAVNSAPLEIADPGRSIWFEIGDPNDSVVGLEAVPSGEGTIRRLSVGGVPAITVDFSNGRFLYLDAASWFTASDVVLNVHYYDSGTGDVSVVYDSFDETVHIPPSSVGAWKSAGRFGCQGSSQWKVASIPMPDARFSGQCNGQDFRLEFGGVAGDCPIRAMWITAVSTNAPMPRRTIQLVDSAGAVTENREARDNDRATLSDTEYEYLFSPLGLMQITHKPTQTVLLSHATGYIPLKVGVRKTVQGTVLQNSVVALDDLPATLRVIGGENPAAVEFEIGSAEQLHATLRIERVDGRLTRWRINALKAAPRDGTTLSEVDFPAWRGVALGGDAHDDWLVVPGYAGHGDGIYFDSIHAGVPAKMAMALNWVSFYDQGRQCGLGCFLDDATDADIYHQHEVRDNASVSQLSLAPVPASLPDAYVLVHAGDWHRVADAYRVQVASRDAAPPNPPWAQDLDGWGYNGNDVDRGFCFLPDVFLRDLKPNGLKLIDGYRQMFDGPWSYAGVYPYPNAYYGTPEELKEATLRIHDAGGRMIHYINYQLSTPDGPSVKRIGPTARAFIPTNVPPPYAPPGYPPITDRSYTGLPEEQFANDRSARAWSDRDLYWARWYAQNVAADGIFFDQLSAVAGGLKETAWNLERITTEARQSVPGFITAGEGVGQAHGRNLTFGLASALFHRTELYHFTMPGHLVMDGGANGAANWGGGDRRWNVIFLNGSRFDGLPSDPAFRSNLVNLRLRTKQLLYQAVFRDTDGVELAAYAAPIPTAGVQHAPFDGVQAKRFVLTIGSSRLVLVNTINTPNQTGVQATVETQEAGPIRAAWAFPWGGDLRQMPFEDVSGNKVRFEVPATEQATVVLVNTCEPLLEVNPPPLLPAGGTGQAAVSVLNLNPEIIEGSVALEAPLGWSQTGAAFAAINPGATQTVVLSLSAAADAVRQIHDLQFVVTTTTGLTGRKYAAVPVVPSPHVQWEYQTGETLRLTLQNLKTNSVSGSVWVEFLTNSVVSTVGAEQPFALAGLGETNVVFHFANWFQLQEPLGIHIVLQSGGTEQRIPIRLFPAVANGGFEIDLAGDGKPEYWTTYDYSSRTSLKDLYPLIHLDSEVKHSGNSSLRIDPLTSSPGTPVRVIPLATMRFPNETYRIATYARVPAGGSISLHMPDSRTLVPEGSPSPDGWQLYAGSYLTGTGVSRNEMYLVNNGSTPVWVDDIAVAANHAPVLSPVSHQNVGEGETLTFAVRATDDDAPLQMLTFSLADAPTGANIDPLTGVFAWTPTEAQGPGVYPLTVRVTDDGAPPLSAEQTFTVTVHEANTAPVLAAMADQLATEHALFALTPSAADGDLPPNKLAWSLGPGAPIGMSIDAEAGSVSWTPDESHGGASHAVTLIVADDGVPPLSDSKKFTITVAEVNSVPQLSVIGHQSVDELSELTFAATASDPNDSPPNVVTLSASGLPAGAAFDPATGVFSWTPGEKQAGDHTVTFTATDNGTPPLSASETITITVTGASLPLRIDVSSLGVKAGRLLFAWPARSGRTYRVQYKSALDDPEWLDSPGAPVLDGPTASFAEDLQGLAPRYYRVVEQDN